MNLWVKRTGQLASLAVALFFLSCSDEVGFNGFSNQNPKFSVRYKEIELESSIFLYDSVRTASFDGELNRVMVGSYADPVFGTVTSSAVSQLVPLSVSLKKDTVLQKVIVDSVRLHLRFDYYQYGVSDVSDQTYSLYQITNKFRLDSTSYVFGDRAVDLVPGPLSTLTLSVNSATFKTQFALANDKKDTTYLKFVLTNELGKQLLLNASDDPNDANDATFTAFNELFRGIAVVPDAGNNKILGLDIKNKLDANSLLSRLTVYYHKTNNATVQQFYFGFQGTNYSKITPDRTTGDMDISGLPSPYTESFPESFRYVQSGTGIGTKIDFSKFYEFADPIQNMIINSCELTVGDIESYDQFEPIDALSLAILRDNNHIRRTRYEYKITLDVNDLDKDGKKTDTLDISVGLIPRDSSEIANYRGFVVDASGVFAGVSDAGTAATLTRNEKNFSTYLTLFTQYLYDRPTDNRFTYFTLTPASPANGRSVNRIVFKKENVKMKIFYTIPIEQEVH